MVLLASAPLDTTSPCKPLIAKGFGDIEAFQKLCPSAPGLLAVRLYHWLLRAFVHLVAADWATSEMDLCARYAAAVLMQQVARNRALAAEVSSF